MEHGSVITMSRSESFKYQILNRFLEGGISRFEASKALDRSMSTVSRQASKIRRDGLIGVKHGNLLKTPHNKIHSEIKNGNSSCS